MVAQRKAAVASKITARLVSLSVEEGSPVKAGQEIARLESDDLEAVRNRALADFEFVRFKIEQAKAELTEATRSYQRNKQLLRITSYNVCYTKLLRCGTGNARRVDGT